MKCGEVFLPPKEFSVLRSERAHSVIKIHDEMHERVNPRVEGAQTSWRNFNPPPPRVRHERVVDNVESRDLVPFSLQDEKILKNNRDKVNYAVLFMLRTSEA